jgi:hypothetical protein
MLEIRFVGLSLSNEPVAIPLKLSRHSTPRSVIEYIVNLLERSARTRPSETISSTWCFSLFWLSRVASFMPFKVFSSISTSRIDAQMSYPLRRRLPPPDRNSKGLPSEFTKTECYFNAYAKGLTAAGVADRALSTAKPEGLEGQYCFEADRTLQDYVGQRLELFRGTSRYKSERGRLGRKSVWLSCPQRVGKKFDDTLEVKVPTAT